MKSEVWTVTKVLRILLAAVRKTEVSNDKTNNSLSGLFSDNGLVWIVLAHSPKKRISHAEVRERSVRSDRRESGRRVDAGGIWDGLDSSNHPPSRRRGPHGALPVTTTKRQLAAAAPVGGPELEEALEKRSLCPVSSACWAEGWFGLQNPGNGNDALPAQCGCFAVIRAQVWVDGNPFPSSSIPVRTRFLEW